MKKLIKIYSLGMLLFFVGVVKAQQAQKFGHIDLNALIQIMPERADAEKQFNAYQKQLEDNLGEMQKELQAIYVEFVNKKDSISDILRNMKEDELNQMNERIQAYQQNARVQLQQKQAEVFQPVFDKADKTIKEIGAEKGLIYIYDTSSGAIPYVSSQS
jgi:outer membrane protein